jgi:hypothetical protein
MMDTYGCVPLAAKAVTANSCALLCSVLLRVSPNLKPLGPCGTLTSATGSGRPLTVGAAAVSAASMSACVGAFTPSTNATRPFMLFVLAMTPSMTLSSWSSSPARTIMLTTNAGGSLSAMLRRVRSR